MVNTQTNLHIDSDVKKSVQKILIDQGKTLSETVELYLKQFLKENQNVIK